MRAIGGGRCKDNPPDSYGASPLYTKGPIKPPLAIRHYLFC